MTARLMADSTTPAAMPSWVSVKAFYIDGPDAAPSAAIDAWRGPKVLINVTGDPAQGGDMLDVENGDATPASIPAWYDRQARLGVRYLGVYSDRDQFDACTAAIGARTAARWLATLDGQLLHTYNGVAITACQNLSASETGANFDCSVIFDDDWHPGWDIRLPSADLTAAIHAANKTQTALSGLHQLLQHMRTT